MAAPREDDPAPSEAGHAKDLAQAYRELLRGEQAATALEANLDNLESKLDALLAAYEPTETTEQSKKGSGSGSGSHSEKSPEKATSGQEETPSQPSKEVSKDEKQP